MDSSYIWCIIQTAAVQSCQEHPYPSVLSYLECSRYWKVSEGRLTKMPITCPLAEFHLHLCVFILIDTCILKLLLGLCQLLPQDICARAPWEMA